MNKLTDQSTKFIGGINLTTAHLAKGLEFDEVIVPFASQVTYRTGLDKNMLYIACTRAMHQLTLTHTGERTPLIPREFTDAKPEPRNHPK